MTGRRLETGKAALALLSAAGLAAALLLPSACGRRAPSLKHVILFIGDGMSAQTEVAASRYLTGRDDGLAWHKLPAKAFVTTWDVNVYNAAARQAGRPPYSRTSFTPLLGYDVQKYGDRPRVGPGAVERFPTGPATDSASAATAMATGYKTDSGNISWLPGDPPDGGLKTIAEDIRDASGAAIGVVSTVPFDHATPAAFVSHNPSRSAYYTGLKDYKGLGIADEIILRTKPDVVIAGGHPLLDNPGFDPKRGYISESLYRTLQASTEYLFVERKPGVDGGQAVAEAAAAAARAGRKLFGLFGGKGGNFDVVRVEDSPGRPAVVPATEENPSLAEATLAALDYLGRDPDGFFLVVEQGDIDWANHDNDFEAMIGSVADLDGAVRAALAFVDRPGDGIDWANTALIVTADHATGGLLLDPGRPLAAGDLPVQAPRVESAEPPAKSGSDRGHGVNGINGAKAASTKTGEYASPFVYPDNEVSYGTAGHANELVNLAAVGAATEELMKLRGTWYSGLILDNTQINTALRRALGLPSR
jgi:alkaline phosphatase